MEICAVPEFWVDLPDLICSEAEGAQQELAWELQLLQDSVLQHRGASCRKFSSPFSMCSTHTCTRKEVTLSELSLFLTAGEL